jgi:hypothetical protein
MLSTETSPSLIESALSEMQSLTLNLYTPMSRNDWERNTAIMNKVLESVGIGRQDSKLGM